jgi:hypothetical protein
VISFDGSPPQRQYMDSGENVNAAEPPHIIVEGPERCADAASVGDLLRQALAHAKAPGPAWVVTMHIAHLQGSAHGLSAQGDITDGVGVNVAHRFLWASSPHCGALARALGVWASLVLDAELTRASTLRSRSGEAGDAPSPSAASSPPPPVPGPAAPPIEAVDGPAPEHDTAPMREDRAGVEMGIAGFVMAETAGRSFAGVSPYVVVDAGHGVFLRPAVAVGNSVPQPGPDAQWVAGRFDACGRYRGLYANGHGLEFTFCGGSEGGFMHTNGVASGWGGVGYAAVGPSVDLRGELAENVAATLRGVGGADIVPAGWSARFELALSWRTP